ncbi:hypothetical protein SAMN04488118_10576 [Epibacterium ulvae]|uniref:Uncharacterized protein n=1 Tax=Epibacterium ulvae TaxID=1156985 RepID=A0A1G5QQC7_9RHOB|nr:hypothetical protein [Epibacterium ulvae]SCZ63501.1 hypothetical protein SAMN04488118_10576 [Epibacterium ulvae]
MQKFDVNALDLNAIEKEARTLRAQATVYGIKTVFSAIVSLPSKLTAVFAGPRHA